DAVRSAAPLLAEAMPFIAHPQIRNRGTVGGSLAHADPAAELPAVMLALEARFRARGPQGERWIPAGEFFTGILATALGPAARPPRPPPSGPSIPPRTVTGPQPSAAGSPRCSRAARWRAPWSARHRRANDERGRPGGSPMKLYDLSQPLNERSSFWPYYPPFEVKYIKRKAEHGVNAQYIMTSNHMGTHLDAPRHFVTAGKTIDELPLEWLCGPGVIVDLRDEMD